MMYVQDGARGVGYGALSGGNGDSDNDAYSDDEDTQSFGSFNGCSDAPQELDPDVTAVSDSPASWGFEELSEKQQPATTTNGKQCVIVHVAACNTAVVRSCCHFHCCCCC
jgi:hypothetical protein